MKKVIVTVFLFAASLLVSVNVASADELEDLKNRIEILEAEMEETNEKFSSQFELGGYADVEYHMYDDPGKNDGFRVHHLAFHFVKEIATDWKLFSEVEFEDGAKIGEGKYSEGKLFVEAAYIEHFINQQANLRFGRYLTPGGIWNVEHYPPFVPTQERPQHIRKMYPQISDGVQFYGSVNAGKVTTDYILYTSNGDHNDGHGDGNNENKAVGGRVKFKLPFLTVSEIGFSAYQEKYDYDVDNANVAEETRTSTGADIKLQYKKLRFQAEYAVGEFDTDVTNTIGGPINTVATYENEGYYAQFIYGIGKWDLIYRYDFYDPKDTVKDDGKTVNTVALNYHFTPYVVGKLEHHMDDKEDNTAKNYDKTMLSIAVYLGK